MQTWMIYAVLSMIFAGVAAVMVNTVKEENLSMNFSTTLKTYQENRAEGKLTMYF